MNYVESVDYLLSLGHETVSIKLGLETIRLLLHELCHPHQTLRAVHVAGTNGKGSTSAMIAGMSRAHGLVTGLYTSPHLVEITERININGEDVTEDDFAHLASRVRTASENLVRRGDTPATPSFFEQVTAAAFLYFAERRVELAVLEVGLGGRLDATNICRPQVCAITSIGSDHQAYLGHTLAEIASEKAGIIKSGIPVISAPQEGEAMRVIERRCADLGAPLTIVDDNAQIDLAEDGFFRLRVQTAKNKYDMNLGLRGRHQVTNALVAIHAGETLGFGKGPIEAGVTNTKWPGRLEVIRLPDLTPSLPPMLPPILIDGAHNADGARMLRRFIDEFYGSSSTAVTLVFGVMSDKALEEMIDALFPVAHRRIAVRIDNPRSVDPHETSRIAAGKGWDTLTAESSKEALDLAYGLTEPNGLICVCGSLYLVGEIHKLLASRRSGP